MSKQVRIRRGSLADLKSIIPASSELAHDTTNNRIHMGNGSLNGGVPHVNFYDGIRETLRTPTPITTGLLANQYAGAFDPPITSYTDGMSIIFRPHVTNTSVPAYALNGISFQFIVKQVGGVLTSIEAGELVAGRNYLLRWSSLANFWVCETLSSGAIPSTGAMRYLATATASSSASLDFTSLVTSQFRNYRFILENITLNTVNRALLARMSNNNGASYPSGGADYNTVLSSGGGATPFSGVILGTPNSVGQSLANMCSVVEWVNPLNTITSKPLLFNSFNPNTGGVINATNGSGSIISAGSGLNAQNAIRFIPEAGLITSGQIHMFGIQNA